MNVMQIFNGNYSHVDIGPCMLHLLTSNDGPFLDSLFKVPDIKRFYVLRDDLYEPGALLKYDQERFAHNGAFTYVITTKAGEKAGIISVEFHRDEDGIVGETSYAILPQYRGNGYAKAALTVLGVMLTGSQINKLVLDISLDNEASMAVARAANFQSDRVGYVDWEHPETGMRKKWTFNLSAKRIILFRKAQECHARKDYASAIRYFQSALEEDYPAGTPFTDAQIIANMGMEYSSNEQYREAYECLTRAEAMGLHNDSITKELGWLTAHRYLW